MPDLDGEPVYFARARARLRAEVEARDRVALLREVASRHAAGIRVMLVELEAAGALEVGAYGPRMQSRLEHIAKRLDALAALSDAKLTSRLARLP